MTEYYLEKHPEIELSLDTITQYRNYELGDTISRAINLIVMEHPNESYMLLKGVLTPKYVKPLILQFFNFRVQKTWLWGIKNLVRLLLYLIILSIQMKSIVLLPFHLEK